MRTTLTLEKDVAILLKRIRAERRQGLKALINEALRAGLAVMVRRPPSRRKLYRTKPESVGHARLPNLDNIAEVIAVAQRDPHA